MRYRSRVVVSALLATVLSATLLPRAASADPVFDEAALVAKLNQLRVSKGVAPLAVDAVLTNVARTWSAQMALTGTLSHNPALALQVPDNWVRLGENVGMGPSVDSLHDAFVASPSHYTNMVSPYFDSVGVGLVQSGSTMWVTYDFMGTQGAPIGSPAAPVPGGGTFTPLTPARTLDTRNGTGQLGLARKVGPRETIVVDATGPGGVPASGVSAVVMNVTVTEATAHSFLTVSPFGGSGTSSLNFVAGLDVANLVTVPVGPDGNVRAYNHAGSTHVLFDVVGWYADATAPPAARHTAVTPARILDTRDGTGRTGVPGKIGPGQTIALDVTGVGEVPPSGVSAVTMNVTVTEGTAPSYVSVTPNGGNTTSSVNFTPGRNVPNLVTVPVGGDGNARIYNRAGFTHVVADVVGWYSAPGATAGSVFTPVAPSRVVDTRDGTGTGGAGTPVGPGQTLTADVTGRGGVPSTGVSAVVTNVTVTQPTAHGFVSVTPAGGSATSNLNFVPGQDVPNLVVVAVGGDGNVRAYNSAGYTHVIFDVVGWFSAPDS